MHIDIRRCALQAHFGPISLNMLKKILQAQRVPGVCFICFEQVLHTRVTRRDEYASNAFGAGFRHASVRFMRVPIL